ncbi:unnamed protein product [Adineta steineri]|uniref:Uncharacterized protein n=1 Tax=Adineta steineri TaxID=433720 RepID=A0A819EFK2_9BILA|nr:unnamed protein product [Adineta steineri]
MIIYGVQVIVRFITITCNFYNNNFKNVLKLVCAILSLGLILLTIYNMQLKIVGLTSIHNEQQLEEVNREESPPILSIESTV